MRAPFFCPRNARRGQPAVAPNEHRSEAGYDSDHDPRHQLLSAASLALVLTVALRAQPGQSPASPSASQAITAEFCGVPRARPRARAAHEAEHAQWKDSLHIKMTKPVAEATIVGDFRDGTKFADHGRAYTFGTKDGKPFVTVVVRRRARRKPSRSTTRSARSATRAICRRCPKGASTCCRCSGTSRASAGSTGKRSRRFPTARTTSARSGTPTASTATPPTSSRATTSTAEAIQLDVDRDGHRLRSVPRPRPRARRADGAWEKDPASKPQYDNSSKNRQLSDMLKILSTRSAEPRRIFDTCAYCHGNKSNVFVGFKGGDRYEDYALPFLMSEPIPRQRRRRASSGPTAGRIASTARRR